MTQTWNPLLDERPGTNHSERNRELAPKKELTNEELWKLVIATGKFGFSKSYAYWKLRERMKLLRSTLLLPLYRELDELPEELSEAAQDKLKLISKAVVEIVSHYTNERSAKKSKNPVRCCKGPLAEFREEFKNYIQVCEKDVLKFFEGTERKNWLNKVDAPFLEAMRQQVTVALTLSAYVLNVRTKETRYERKSRKRNRRQQAAAEQEGGDE